MNITVLGSTGMAGTAIVQEATHRGHHVIAASRHPYPTAEQNVTPTAIDLKHPDGTLSQVLDGTDAAVLAVRMRPGNEAHLPPLTAQLLDRAHLANVRVLVVGGSAPLRSPQDPNVLVLDDPAYVPPQLRKVAAASLDQYTTCASHQNQHWIYLSPSAMFEPGQGTGSYRRGGDTLLINNDGTSRVTPPDLALAVLDELEHPSTRHHFTVIERDSTRSRYCGS